MLTHAACDGCYRALVEADPDKYVYPPARLLCPLPDETCCFCGLLTESGIYVGLAG